MRRAPASNGGGSDALVPCDAEEDAVSREISRESQVHPEANLDEMSSLRPKLPVMMTSSFEAPLDDALAKKIKQHDGGLWDRSRLMAERVENLPPVGVVCVMFVGVCMALWSFILVLLPAPFVSDDARVEIGDGNTPAMLWLVTTDCFAIQNLGHGAFLIMFATSWWRNRNVL